MAGAGVGTIDARTAGPPGPLIPGSGGRRLRVADDPFGALGHAICARDRRFPIAERSAPFRATLVG